jgi:hypothetical protein
MIPKAYLKKSKSPLYAILRFRPEFSLFLFLRAYLTIWRHHFWVSGRYFLAISDIYRCGLNYGAFAKFLRHILVSTYNLALCCRSPMAALSRYTPVHDISSSHHLFLSFTPFTPFLSPLHRTEFLILLRRDHCQHRPDW